MTSYRLAPLAPDTFEAEFKHLTSHLKILLYNRGLHDPVKVEAFLKPSYDDHQHDPLLLNDMSVAVGRILKAIKDNERIAIFSDYDCDGIPGAVILHDFFTAIKFSNFTNYIPHRHYEGFGFSEEAALKLAEDRVVLIITIDCGTGDHVAIAKAKELNIDVIVTDHHEPKETLPVAVAIVNPKVGDTYPFDGLCGSGVVYKLIQALLSEGKKQELFTLPNGYEKWWLDMVGVATIADMVPLVGENRVFARYGLEVLRKSRRPGLQQLLRKNQTSQRHVTEDDVGFTIGPRINAASRMGNPQEAFSLLATSDEAKAGGHLANLEKLNNERKGLVASMTKDIHGRLKKMDSIPAVLVMGNPDWRPSLVGLAANKLAEELKRPVFLWGRDGNGVIKGSCRSNGQVSVITLMNAMPDHFLEHGGHHMSGGFAVAEEKVHTFLKTINTVYDSLGEQVLVDEEVIIDASLTLEDINKDLINIHEQLAPFGHTNPKPLYEFKNVVPIEVVLFGKAKDHLKLNFTSAQGPVEAIAFFRTTEGWPKEPKAKESIDLIGHVEQSFFMGRMQTRIRIVDIL
jgi:single-stranded-DNA-specific exonuclease